MNFVTDIDKYIIKNKQTIESLEKAFLKILSSKYVDGFFETEIGKTDLDANISNRYINALKHVVPWVGKHINLSGTKMIEIGCGTASSTAAFSHFVDQINGYDIDEQYINFAKKRFEICDIKNAHASLVSETDLCRTLQEHNKGGVDIFLLYAVLEHQTVEERLETIKTCWELLRPGGLMVVTDTPNLLIYNDVHTSQLPFMHFLPDLTYELYSKKSPRDGFNSHFARNKFDDKIELGKAITRWGRGVSYHDFELSLGAKYKDYIVANGFEEEILSWLGVGLEEELLRMYVMKHHIDIPLAFTRFHLNFILRKDGQTPETELPAPPDFSIIADREEYDKLSDALAEKDRELGLILNSKRWRLGNIIAWPYRSIKRMIKKDS